MTTRGWWWGVVPLLAACTGTPVTPEQRQLAERRLLAPFLAPREVGCGELFVELTGNFHGNVGEPAVDRTRHTVTREQGDGFVETVWTNTTGTPESAFVITIGAPAALRDDGTWSTAQQTRFRVVNQLRRRVYEDRRDLTLNATAGGAYVFVQDASAPPREVAGFAIVDGALRAP
jgi:hypothetical protein